MLLLFCVVPSRDSGSVELFLCFLLIVVHVFHAGSALIRKSSAKLTQRFCVFCSPAGGSSNKASGWFGAAARNLEPGSARIKVPLLKVQVPKVPGSTLKSSGSPRSTQRSHS